ncbi:MAG: FecR domain-containing protein [Burkholderiales bacterium]|nr:FecR domain-containing protein [Burkholderiales bacterium]
MNTGPDPADAASSNHIDERLGREALDWLVRRRAGIDAAEEAAFQAWLNSDPACSRVFARWQAEWDGLDALPAEGLDVLRHNLSEDKRRQQQSAERAQAVEGLDVLRRNLAQDRHTQAMQPRFGRCNWMPRAAVAFVLLLVVGVAAWQAWDYWWQQPVFAQTWQTARGQQMSVTLPDGSVLQLDTATRVDATYYRERREVQLPEGEVMFQVTGDAQRVFDVLAGPLRITVVGTRFSVRYTPEVPGAEGVRVAVETGRVKVSPRDPADAGHMHTVELTAGQQLVASALGVLGPVSAVPRAGIAPWRQGQVSFDDTPLAQALAEFERYGATSLQIRDSAVAALRVTGAFDVRRPKNFARVLPQVLPVRLRDDAGVTEIVLGARE